MIQVLTEMVAACAVCDQVCGERDLQYVEADNEIDGCAKGDVVCSECVTERIKPPAKAAIEAIFEKARERRGTQ